MFTLEVVVYSPHALKVLGVVGGPSFTSINQARAGGVTDFRFKGAEATLTEALSRLERVKDAICVLEEVTED